MLRECMEREALAKILLESERFFRMFDFIVLDSFDISSDAHRTFRVSQYLEIYTLVQCYIIESEIMISCFPSN